MHEGVLLALDIEATQTVRDWIDFAGISVGFLLKRILGARLNLAMDPGQIIRLFKSIAVNAELDPKEIGG
jgi:hypothetical protein